MAYVITSKCVGTKDLSCAQVCPVDCIHPMDSEPGFEHAQQLFIDPDSCIDCDACFEACPVNAIYPQAQVPAEYAESVELNRAHFDGL